jgi:hypothetical protein
MRLRTETTFGVGALLALQLVTAFGAIGLLTRVSPAAEQILRENVYSTEAVEEMLATLAAPRPDPERFEAALVRAEGNVTEADELPLLRTVRVEMDSALLGEPDARSATIAALLDLSAVNRGSMHSADEAAQRIGVTGAWAAVLLGSVSFFLGAGVYRRLRERLEQPILNLDSALSAARAGDHLRRCPVLGSSEELDRISENLNWLLDALSRPEHAAAPDRIALLALLDQLPEPTLLHHAQQGVLASNRAALERSTLDIDAPGWRVTRLPDTALRLLRWLPGEE